MNKLMQLFKTPVIDNVFDGLDENEHILMLSMPVIGM